MLKKLVEQLVKTLVAQPEKVVVAETETAAGVALEVTVDEHDLGRVIGKDGQTIRAIRGLAALIMPAGQEINISVVNRSA